MKKDREKNHKKRSVLFRTMILTWVVIALALGILLIMMIPFQRKSLVRSFESSTKVIATSIDQVTITSVLVGDYSSVVEHCMKVVSERPSMKYIVITKNDGFSLVFTRQGWRYDTLDGFWIPNTVDANQGRFLISTLVNEEVFHFSHRLQYSALDWGWIHIGLSLDAFSQSLRWVYNRTLLLGISSLVIASVFSFGFAQRFSRPILSLNRVTQEISRGNLNARAVVETGDELETLADSFNRMTEFLKASYEELEIRVQERTKELEKTNKKLRKEIQERKRFEKALQESEVRYRTTIDSMQDAIHVVDTELKITLANRFCLDWLEKIECESDIIGKSIVEAFPFLEPSVEVEYNRVLKTGESCLTEERVSVEGLEFMTDTLKIPIVEDGKLSGIVTMVRDVTSKRRAEEALRESEEQFRSLAEQSPNMIFINQSGRIVYANKRCEEVTGFTRDELIHPKFDFHRLITPESMAAEGKAFDQHMMGNEIQPYEYVIKTKRGELIDGIITTKLIDYRGNQAILGIITDITEWKKAEKQIKASLKEKEVLLKEIHHRVKNNLQVISSLLYLQSKKIKDKKAFEVFIESQNRVKSMALIHEKLYQSKDFSDVDFGEYVATLADHLLYTYGIPEIPVRLRTDIKDANLSIDTAIPCGLIINELLTNSLKYAFPAEKGFGAQKPCEVIIEFYSLNDDHPSRNGFTHVLSIGDNGIGLPDHFDYTQSDTLGLQLVNGLVNQLKGRVIVEGKKGTTFTISLDLS